jgi:hypothetical protein
LRPHTRRQDMKTVSMKNISPFFCCQENFVKKAPAGETNKTGGGQHT